MKADVGKKTRSGTMKDKVTRSGTSGGYEVTGWRYANDASWHVKVWRAGHQHEWMGYSMTAGVFELETGDQTHKEAALHVIGEWGCGKAEPRLIAPYVGSFRLLIGLETV
jgi:hypothetical protein